MCPLEIVKSTNGGNPILKVKQTWNETIPAGSILGIAVKMYSNLFKGIEITPLYKDILNHIVVCKGPSLEKDNEANVSAIGRMATLEVQKGVGIPHHIVGLYNMKDLEPGETVIVHCQTLPLLTDIDDDIQSKLDEIQKNTQREQEESSKIAPIPLDMSSPELEPEPEPEEDIEVDMDEEGNPILDTDTETESQFEENEGENQGTFELNTENLSQLDELEE
jgi:hypothetical protein